MTSYPNTLYLFALYQGTKPHHYIFEDYPALPSNSSSLRYFKLAGPVIPGFKSNILLSPPCRLSAYPGTSGRGPTKLISPISTFHNSGSSSILYFLNLAPNGVIRLSPFTETELPECPTVIERNLYMVNNLPYRPTLFCLNITGPPGILTRIRRAVTNKIGERKRRPRKATIWSKRDFNSTSTKFNINFLY